ncbi:MAG: ribonuclease H-like domain-containing protein [Lamprobacter sp.]|uniref:ribonuclease H-like domain-containing protein n=1 Tax=Lamprobacter sp. TaxID=3100796 RepID=UPI002B25F11B|nr:ribonuclease H-like domain-containing protein [Lamprobacter sp.]MEA3638999.1 ribonuclease H-like domain-containing protein [Lamprobacter sp.]
MRSAATQTLDSSVLSAESDTDSATDSNSARQVQSAADTAVTGQLGAEPSGPCTPRRSLAERIRRLSVAGPTRSQPRPTPEALADSLGAELIAPGLLQLERQRPLSQRHGRFQLAKGLSCCTRGEPDLSRLSLPDAEGWRFLDTETSGLAGGTGTWAFVVGIGRIQGAELCLRQYLLLELDAEAAMMARVQSELAAANLLISYNGKRFDLPLLETRLRLNGLSGLSDTLDHLDLLYPVRRAFARRWPDCCLARCEQRLLNVERDDDLPGAEAPAAWLDWLRAGSPARLGAVLRHNRLDLLSLAVLLPALAEVQSQPQAFGADLLSLARHLLRSGQAQEAERLLESHLLSLEPAAALVLAQLQRRRGAWSEAVSIWQRLAADAMADAAVAALVELAKYQEHVKGDLAQALAYAEQLPDGEAHRHRRARLRRRLMQRNLQPRGAEATPQANP